VKRKYVLPERHCLLTRCTLSPDELKAVVAAYRQKFNADLQKQIHDNCSTQGVR
jgi:hypothetical protein